MDAFTSVRLSLSLINNIRTPENEIEISLLGGNFFLGGRLAFLQGHLHSAGPTAQVTINPLLQGRSHTVGSGGSLNVGQSFKRRRRSRLWWHAGQEMHLGHCPRQRLVAGHWHKGLGRQDGTEKHGK